MSAVIQSPTGPQIERLQHLLEWLRSERPLTTRRAANRFGVARRTIANDIKYLRKIGVPLEYDAKKGSYFLTEPYGNLPLLSLSRTDFAAFLVARHALEALGDSMHASILQQVAERLATHLPETIHLESDLLTRTLRIEMGPKPHAPLRHLEALEEAVQFQQVVWIRYFSNHRAALTEREIEPYALLSYQSRWYVIAYCRHRQEMRDFRVDRIKDLAVRPHKVFSLPRDFDLDRYLGPAFGMHRGDRTYAVHVRFSPYQARWIQEERWHESQVMALRTDGTLDVRMQVTGLNDIARWVLSYGAEAEVISPPVLRHRVAREARRLAALYADVGPLNDETTNNDA